MTNKLQLLHDSGIHFTIESYYDIGFSFYLGDRFNGIANHKSFPEFDQGVEWLWTEAKKKNPDNKCFDNVR
jgi:hypothetical protein